jgi:glycyl-tRNA synthetase beta chain
MNEFLLELFSEEIPARFQRKAAEDLKKSVSGALMDAGLMFDGAACFVTPRRLALVINGLPLASPDIKEEKKGPRVGAPEQALAGFLRGAGLSSIDEAAIKNDPKKGDFYVAVIEKKGLATTKILSEILPKIINGFSWAKSMRWGSGKLNWVRPLRSIVAVFSDDEKSEIVAFEIDGIKSGNISFGHRFLSPGSFEVKRFDDYAISLEKAKVVLDIDRRIEIIKGEAEQLAFAQGFKLIADKKLLEETAGLVEFPVVMMGSFESSFLRVPKEAIVATIKANQKCFCLEDANGELVNKFILVSNMIADDGGKTIIAGNERVIRARLSDALFFYENDLKIPLVERLPKLKEMVFHAKLGDQFKRVDRIENYSCAFAKKIGADSELALRAATLAKADLVTEMVGEFPKLQGIMGRYYALAQGENSQVANAIETHYKPVGFKDEVPTDPVAIAVALADKLDLLTMFWVIDEKPTGSRDPFALRRAALGVIRILVENKIKLPLHTPGASLLWILLNNNSPVALSSEKSGEIISDLINFFHERLKGMLRDKGARHDLVDAVITLLSDDMLEITQRVNALSSLLEKEVGENLLAGYRRAVNILVAEEKKDGVKYLGDVDSELLTLAPEQNLAVAIGDVKQQVEANIASDDFAGAIEALADLHKPVDEFFADVMVNDDDGSVRVNRLNLLASLRDVMHLVADFSKVEG